MTAIERFLPHTRIAYFSMEIALRPEIHTYSGGLGVLAGDTARSSADLALPMVFVTLISRQGYLKQEIDAAGAQVHRPDKWDPAQWAEPLDAMVAVPIEGRPVWIRPWLYVVASPVGHEVPVLLLDTQLEQNAPEDRGITDVLYGGDAECRLKQEIVLGIGGQRVLRALEFDISTYHLNEGHAALLPASLLRRYPDAASVKDGSRLAYDASRVREQCVFTTHTPVEAGHDQFEYALAARLLGDFLPLDQLKVMAGDQRLNMTALALHLSGYVNGVAVSHVKTTRRMFPEFQIREITNGVHAPTWVHPALAVLFDDVAPGWRQEPGELVNVDIVDDRRLWEARHCARRELLEETERLTGRKLSLDLPTIVFARRMTGYKRPGLIFEDTERLRAIAKRFPFQLIIAGKAHPEDAGGNKIIRQLQAHMRSLRECIPTAYLPNYDLRLAKRVTAGADIWLNTPLPPLEASGTSGMKAGMNGVLNLSVLDGWWAQGWIEGQTGWAIGEGGGPAEKHAQFLYAKLEGAVLPLYRDQPAEWARMMKSSIGKIGSRFNSSRMMRRYASEAYLR